MVNYNINKETNKRNSFFYDKVDDNIISNIAKLYTFNVPLIVVLLERKENKISVQQDTYIKLFDKNCKNSPIRTRGKEKSEIEMFVEDLIDSEYKQPITYLTTGGEKFKSISNNSDKRGMDPPQMGLIDNNTCKLRYLNIKQDIAKKHTKNIKIDFITYVNKLLKYPKENNTLRTLNKEIKESAKMDDFIELNADNIIKVIDSNNEEKGKYKELTEMLTIGHRIETAIKDGTRKITDKFIDIADNTTIYVYAFKYIETSYGMSILLLYSTAQTATVNTIYRTIWSPSNTFRLLDCIKQEFKYLQDKTCGTHENKPIKF
jgi:hypothetical protein